MTDFLGKMKTKVIPKIGTSSFLEISGNNEMLISGCIGIEEYGNELIKVETVLGQISVIGENLHLAVYRGDIMTVQGKVNIIKLGESL